MPAFAGMAVCLFGCLIFIPPAHAAPVINIATHRALYEFRLASASAGAGIVGIKGRMYFEQDDVCEAWTTEHRFASSYQYAEREAEIDSSHYVAYEAKDQSQFSFSSEREEDGETTEKLRGSVEIAADGSATAVYALPEDLRYGLPKGYMLPTTHTMEVIRHARAGDTFFNAVMFDGTDAEGPVEIGTFIGKKAAIDEITGIAEADKKKIDATLLTPDAWHVRMAIFPMKEDDEITPVYEMDMILHDNGVVSRVLIDYRTFRVEQNLSALERLPEKKCK
jgi:hypothetical protein